MKNFLIYSKKPIQHSINLDDAINIRFLRKGLRLFYIFDLTGIIYAISNRFYLLSFLILLNSVLVKVLLSFEALEPFAVYLITFKYSINVLLVIFGFEIEEFLLKRKKYKFQTFAVAKNSKIAFENLISELQINFVKKPSKMMNFIKKFTQKCKKQN